MKRFGWLFWLLIVGLVPACEAQTGTVNGFCQNGGAKVSSSGITSTTTVQQSFPSCKVYVYLTGTTTIATIYADKNSTPLDNPFTASATGKFMFYAAGNAGLDVTITGGTTPNTLSAPVTLYTNVFPSVPNGGGGVTQIVAGTNVTISPTSGVGVVTVNSSGGGGGGCDSNCVITDPTTSQAINQPVDTGLIVNATAIGLAVTDSASGSGTGDIQITAINQTTDNALTGNIGIVAGTSVNNANQSGSVEIGTQSTGTGATNSANVAISTTTNGGDQSGNLAVEAQTTATAGSIGSGNVAIRASGPSSSSVNQGRIGMLSSNQIFLQNTASQYYFGGPSANAASFINSPLSSLTGFGILDFSSVGTNQTFSFPSSGGTICTTATCTGGSGTVTTTGFPASGNMTKFSGSTSITNAVSGTDYQSPITLTTTGTTGASTFTSNTLNIPNYSAGASGVSSINSTTGAFTFTGSGVSCVTTTCTFSGGGSAAFSSITSGTNTTAAMLVGTGASLAPTGTGTITATAIDGVTVTGTPTSGQVITATSGTAASWQTPSGGGSAVDIMSDQKATGTGYSFKTEYLATAIGAPITILSRSGAGYVSSILLALTGTANYASGTLQVSVNGETTPSINVTLRNLFANWFTSGSVYGTKFISLNGSSGGFGEGITLSIPYATGVVIRFIPTAAGTIWSTVTGQDSVPDTWPYTRKLHINSIDSPTPGSVNGVSFAPYSYETVLNWTGPNPGRLVGLHMYNDATANSPAEASLEGNVAIYADTFDTVRAPSTPVTSGNTILDPNGNFQTVTTSGTTSSSLSSAITWGTVSGITTTDGGAIWTAAVGTPLNIWKTGSAYIDGMSIIDQIGNVETVTTPGTAGASEPTFCITAGCTTAEGSIIWTMSLASTMVPAAIVSSGTEDFFNTGFYGASVTQNLQGSGGTSGITFKTGGMVNFYRYYYNDPIRFTHSVGIIRQIGDPSQVPFTGNSLEGAAAFWYTQDTN